ncbi:hypothetical protein RND71_043747 [Anisodus tanguticus]|uniref:Phosphomannomutase n=1 Tax=Anisodus tanguticus TaxID=243964 RepID=A0AAE1QN45_9SOLA|nr:hypothetical protein RND71_043747 [Anisodus tanguticus]
MLSKTICLFDVDGTLTKPRLVIEQDMYNTLTRLKEKVTVGLVGGSDLIKIAESPEEEVLNFFDYVFTENGLTAYVKGKIVNCESILLKLGEETCQELINFCLSYISKLKLPCKRGQFIEFRNGMINVSPVGRSCSVQERIEFFEFDKKHKIREAFVKILTEKFGKKYGLKFSIGGQISIDVFPIGWDKTYCLKFLDNFDKIYFFGDRTNEGGNDYEIYSHAATNAYNVEDPKDTISYLKSLFEI